MVREEAFVEKKHLLSQVLLLVPVVGVEPTRYRYHWILSPARLPIPSYRRMTDDIIPYSCPKIKGFFKILEIFFKQILKAKKDTPAQGRGECLRIGYAHGYLIASVINSLFVTGISRYNRCCSHRCFGFVYFP